MTRKEIGAGRSRRPPSRRPPSGRPSKRDLVNDTPIARLSRATTDGALVRPEDLQAVLAAHAIQANRQAQTLATRGEQLLEMLFAPELADKEEGDAVKPPDPSATLEVITRLSKLYTSYSGELRKSISLMDHLARPRPPSLKVVASGEQINLGATQQVNNDRRCG